ncbi:MAG: hypothetical protein K2H53_05890 [Clostridia bacterium]|nr:hypothetical protein [Clostridia bacterium]
MEFKNSNELLDHALRELQTAVTENKQEVTIVLEEYFDGDSKAMLEIVEKLEIKSITERLREEFSDFSIKSRVECGHLSSIITFKTGPCDIRYKLIWKLELIPKEA